MGTDVDRGDIVGMIRDILIARNLISCLTGDGKRVWDQMEHEKPTGIAMMVTKTRITIPPARIITIDSLPRCGQCPRI
jgi:hypothetical protein